MSTLFNHLWTLHSGSVIVPLPTIVGLLGSSPAGTGKKMNINKNESGKAQTFSKIPPTEPSPNHASLKFRL